MFIPLLTGACVGILAGGGAASIAPFSIAAFTLFWLRTPVENWMGAGPIRARTSAEVGVVRNVSLILAAVSAGALAWLFWGGRNRGLVWIGACAGAAFLTQAAVKRIWRGARMPAQMIGAAGLTSSAAAAYYVVTGRWGLNAWSLWAANLLFAVNQIHYVQVQIQAARSRDGEEKRRIGDGFLAGQVLLVVLLVGACGLHLFRWSAAIAFVPVLWRGFAWLTAGYAPLAIHAVGKKELAYACIFGVLLIFGMQLP